MLNGVMIEYFEFDLKYEDHLWEKLRREARYFGDFGITAVWLPPAFKGSQGTNDTGYGVYDLYDLGEFDQKGSIATKYGTKLEYLMAIHELHRYEISVYADIVMNHRIGSDGANETDGVPVSYGNRNHVTGRSRKVSVPTQFNYPARNNRYSSFKWTADHFNGADYDFITQKNGIFLLGGKSWSQHVGKEFGNYDYLMGANVDLSHPDVRAELMRFGHWYAETAELEGFRLDALKHMDYVFVKDWLAEMRSRGRFFAVGEYWSGVTDELMEYLGNVDYSMSLFDVPLHYHFFEASHHRNTYDMRNLYKDTLVDRDSGHAVTFVDNHDTQPGQALHSFVQMWFKPFAYACILLRQEGYPCIFYGDFYGLHMGRRRGISKQLGVLLKLRQKYAYGTQHDYITECQFGFSREGGIAVLFSLRQDGYERMYVGRQYAHQIFKDVFHRHSVVIDEEGYGAFYCTKEKLSVYIPAK